MSMRFSHVWRRREICIKRDTDLYDSGLCVLSVTKTSIHNLPFHPVLVDKQRRAIGHDVFFGQTLHWN